MNIWQARVNHLRSAGLPMVDIAQAVDLSITALYDIKIGRTAEPRGMAAVKLYGLAERHGFVAPSREAA